ncbi:ATP-dependent helicase BRM [Gastrolobium bilobum]|uniref:ATP-dependent helicase BRM n=1 Tax=Gastrolobium bilobum TaxID=150636 RepID=UPI002AB21657|nr:ATP-dependent helicase BRM [Gastrolobium bilobum]XP_061360033.1 ATP-dependent helicase BRM [Gastrolobium bilobum]
MQSGGSGGGPGRNPAGRAASTSSAAASPSSPSSAASHLGLDSLQQQQQKQHQQQQIGSRQSFQQHLLRKSEGNEAFLAYQAGLQGFGSNNFSSPSAMQLPQQSQKFMDLAQRGSNQGQGVEQQMLNPAQQAYLQYAFQASQQKSALAMQSQQQPKMGMLGPSSMKDQEMRMGNLKMQDLMSMQAVNQAQGSSSRNSSEHFAHGEKQIEQGQQLAPDQKSEGKPSIQGPAIGHLVPGNIIRPGQALATQQSIPNAMNNQIALSAQLRAMQAWAHERNIDLSNPANANLMAQFIPLAQSRMVQQSKANDTNTVAQSSPVPVSNQQVTSPAVASEGSAHANSSSDVSAQSGSAKSRQMAPPSHLGPPINAGISGNSGDMAVQQFSLHGRDAQGSLRQPVIVGNGMPSMHPQQSSANVNIGANHPLNAKASSSGPEPAQMQYTRQLNQYASQAGGLTNEGGSGNYTKPQGAPSQMPTQQNGFTKQQLHVLKAQILAFRRLKKGEGTLPQELLQAIVPPPLDSQIQQPVHSAGRQNQEKSVGNIVAEQPRQNEFNSKDSQPIPTINGKSSSKHEGFVRDEKSTVTAVHMQAMSPVTKESAGKEEQQYVECSAKSDKESECGISRIPVRNEVALDRGKAIAPQASINDTMQVNKPAQTSTVAQPKEVGPTIKYHGPLFDFPFFTRKHDSFGSSLMVNNNNNLSLAYDVKELLYEEGMEVLNSRRTENLKKIEGLLVVNLERKRIRPDLVLKLQIEEKKLRLLDLQARLRDEIDQQQQEIMAMPDRPYRKFVRLCERQRMELARQVQASQRALREKQLKSIFQWRKKLLEAHWAIRDARTARNRGVAKYHERMLREFSKRKDDDRNKRMEALKNNDVDRYREMLLEQQTSIPGDAAERYAVLSTFLSQTEDYLHKLGSKITAAKNQQEVEEAAKAAAAAARLQGLSEEEVRAAAACAGDEVTIRNRFMEMNAPRDNSSVSKYYNLAHAVHERVVRQPSMLRAGTLRDYQLVGLQWMLSLYNNKLNGILADEMGLGKTVQVMALIAYLMEYKGNYGPHLIIVPNAVLVNWKSELHTWLPSVSCIYYVGTKDHRSKLFSQEVMAMKFNVLVTTYEFIMFDRSKLSKIDWKYIVIDEAQRMKDRDSVLARDLDRYRCQRRLLLTGTPLQNDLKELWSLLNLLLPEVFDNRKAFHDWFSKPFQKEGPSQNAEDDWLETEKKVIIIHRLHQILEPFMLRRRVEDVEGSLPPKVSIVLKCKMSAVQSAIYDWIKSTGTLRLDPEDEQRRIEKNPVYQAKQYKTLNNRCMELRKTCNHPLLNYSFDSDLSKDFIVKSCGKLWILDRILIKLQRTGHRVLLFSTMTKLLDILEEYLQWRRLVFRRIDGTTSLEDRESAIVDFNSPNSDCFIFLLSIRAAGRGLNLQSADTVVIYDPDPNPKNEEQAVARAHRIGQRREVKVIYMEAVVDKIPSHQKEDELRNGGTVDMEDELAGKDRYIGSIESLIRNNIQQYKIDMADEVINAGRFDQRTTHEERRLTLETLLHDEERYQENVHDVPSLQEVNRMIARSEEEVELFDQMDEELDWIEEMTRYDQVPPWLRANTREVNAAIAALSKKPSKNILLGGSIGMESGEVGSERRRGRPKGKKHPSYKELEDENGEYSEVSSEDRNGYSAHEEGEIGEFEDDGYSGADGAQPMDKDQLEDGPLFDAGYEFPRSSEIGRNNHLVEEAGSSGSSSDGQRLTRTVSPSVSSQKFGSLSALDSRPSSISKRMGDELEEGEIAVSGDSHVDHQQSGSWIHDRDEGEDEQVLQQPKIKRKRSLRVRPRHAMEKPEDKSGSEMASLQCGESSSLLAENKYQVQTKTDPESKSFGDSIASKHDKSGSSLKNKRNLPSRKGANSSKLHGSSKSSRLNCASVPSEDGGEQSRKSWEKPINLSGSSAHGTKMTEIIHSKCKSVIGNLQKRVDKEGHQIVPLLTDLWKKIENSGNSQLDLRKIDQRIDRLEYNGVMEIVSDVQSLLRSTMQFYGCSYEVRSEAKKVHDLFFEILKTAFRDMDFREAKSALPFSSQTSAKNVASPRQGTVCPSKRQRVVNDVETDPCLSQKPLQRGSASNSENARIKGHLPQKESRTGSGSGSAREQLQQDNPSLPTHPGELVVCKKRRNDREKTLVKARTGSAGPVSPPSIGPVIRSPRSGSTPKDARVAQQTPPPAQGWVGQPSQQPNGSGGSVGWAKHVKRHRTDSGKRRPSHI